MCGRCLWYRMRLRVLEDPFDAIGSLRLSCVELEELDHDHCTGWGLSQRSSSRSDADRSHRTGQYAGATVRAMIAMWWYQMKKVSESVFYCLTLACVHRIPKLFSRTSVALCLSESSWYWKQSVHEPKARNMKMAAPNPGCLCLSGGGSGFLSAIHIPSNSQQLHGEQRALRLSQAHDSQLLQQFLHVVSWCFFFVCYGYVGLKI